MSSWATILVAAFVALGLSSLASRTAFRWAFSLTALVLVVVFFKAGAV